MCYRQKNHVTYFKPYKDADGINRVYTCTILDKETGRMARGVSILSLDDEPKDDKGRQLAYNKAVRALAGRYTHPVVLEKAWEAVQALTASEMRDFISVFSIPNEVEDNGIEAAYIVSRDELTVDEFMHFVFKRKCSEHFVYVPTYNSLAKFESPHIDELVEFIENLDEEREDCTCGAETE